MSDAGDLLDLGKDIYIVQMHPRGWFYCENETMIEREKLCSTLIYMYQEALACKHGADGELVHFDNSIWFRTPADSLLNAIEIFEEKLTVYSTWANIFTSFKTEGRTDNNEAHD